MEISISYRVNFFYEENFRDKYQRNNNQPVRFKKGAVLSAI